MRRAARGFTLIEVVIGMLLIALMVGPLFSVALTARQSKQKTYRRTAASLAGSRLLETLKLYVTADTAAATGPGNAPNGWGLPGDPCGCHALTPGVHTLNAATWLPAELANDNGAVSYTVTSLGGTQPHVELTITWGAAAGGGGGPPGADAR